MRKLTLTGLATEQPFFPKSGNIAMAAKYFLIFNDGEFRVETTETGAETCVQKMMEDGETNGTPLFTQEEIEEQRQQMRIEEQVPQPRGQITMGKVGSAFSADEDGVDQV